MSIKYSYDEYNIIHNKVEIIATIVKSKLESNHIANNLLVNFSKTLN